MKKYLKKVMGSIILSIICGSICGRLVYEIYDTDLKKEISGKKIYLIQSGAYSTYDNMVDSTLVNNYVYYEDEGMYKVIVGVTEDKDNVDKIKNAYGDEVIVSEYYSKDTKLNEKINEYDKKISTISEKEDIQKMVLEMLKLYKDNDNSTLVKISS
jgi:hypothetical protein